jgi:dsRNA-specific ribonuclease
MLSEESFFSYVMGVFRTLFLGICNAVHPFPGDVATDGLIDKTHVLSYMDYCIKYMTGSFSAIVEIPSVQSVSTDFNGDFANSGHGNEKSTNSSRVLTRYFDLSDDRSGIFPALVSVLETWATQGFTCIIFCSLCSLAETIHRMLAYHVSDNLKAAVLSDVTNSSTNSSTDAGPINVIIASDPILQSALISFEPSSLVCIHVDAPAAYRQRCERVVSYHQFCLIPNFGACASDFGTWRELWTEDGSIRSATGRVACECSIHKSIHEHLHCEASGIFISEGDAIGVVADYSSHAALKMNPIYVTEEISTGSGEFYRASLYIQDDLSQNASVFVGKPCESPRESKQAAALSCCLFLHVNGHLNGSNAVVESSALVLDSSSSEAMKRYSFGIADPSTSQSISSNSSKAAKNERVTALHSADELIYCDCKQVPDAMSYSMTESNERNRSEDRFEGSEEIKLTKHYIYSFSAVCKCDEKARVQNSCAHCRGMLTGMQSICVGYLSALPDAIVAYSFDIILRGIAMKVSVTFEEACELPISYRSAPLKEMPAYVDPGHFDGSRPIDVLVAMQRFHKAVGCWEIDLSIDNRRPLSISEWTSSSGGCYYIVLPKYDKQESPAMSPQWASYIFKCSVEASTLVWNVNNLSSSPDGIQDFINGDIPTVFSRNSSVYRDYVSIDPNPAPFPSSDDANIGAQFIEKLLCRNRAELYVGYISDKPTNFSSILKYVAAPESSTAETTDSPIKPKKVPVTFEEYYRSKKIIPEECLDRLVKKPNYTFLSCFQVTRSITLELMLLPSGLISKVKHPHIGKSELLPEFCVILGEAKWFFAGILLSSLLWRVQSLVLAYESSQFLHNLIKEAYLSRPEISQHLADNPVAIDVTLESLTVRMALESMNNERLESLGDSILKLLATLHVYHNAPYENEQVLSSFRGKLISNENLFNKSIETGYFVYIRGNPLSDGRQASLFRPSGKSRSRRASLISLWNTILHDRAVDGESVPELHPVDVITATEVGPAANLESVHFMHDGGSRTATARELSEAEYSSHIAVQMKRKVVADHLEAAIGAFYLRNGLLGAQAIIDALGVFERHDTIESIYDSVSVPRFSVSHLEAMARPDIRRSMVTTESASISMDLLTTRVFPQLVSPPRTIHVIRHTSEIKCSDKLNCGLNSIENVTIDVVASSESSDVLRTIHSGIDKDLMQFSIDSAAAVSQYGTECLNMHFAGLEKALGYAFKSKLLLTELFCNPNANTFERLEFLGDAALDAAVMCELYDNQLWAAPGHLSFQKSDATSNIRLAAISLELSMDAYFLRRDWSQNSNTLLESISLWRSDKQGYARAVDSMPPNRTSAASGDRATVEITTVKATGVPKTSKSIALLLQYERMAPSETSSGGASIPSIGASEELESELQLDGAVLQWSAATQDEQVVEMSMVLAALRATYKAPFEAHVLFLKRHKSALKLMADVFEAVLGAVYIDCGYDLGVVRNIVKKLNMLPQLKSNLM